MVLGALRNRETKGMESHQGGPETIQRDGMVRHGKENAQNPKALEECGDHVRDGAEATQIFVEGRGREGYFFCGLPLWLGQAMSSLALSHCSVEGAMLVRLTWDPPLSARGNPAGNEPCGQVSLLVFLNIVSHIGSK